MPPRSRRNLGRGGEDHVAMYLAERGWVIVERNWRCRYGELDIIALDGATLVVVEVKTRSSLTFGHPAEAVDGRKLARIRRLTGLWLAQAEHPAYDAVRIDVAAVIASSDGLAVSMVTVGHR
ncbi:putative endonuclease [Rarobacter incanus]|uniref:UPF0102 protein FB389_0048 n=2 Tax=Rarobacter incanus TaxID=153494 RepID=A0A542SLC5_9MICO|nr:YraN family protein [Rarobacter incanus]TQK75422.1 putative endonuclease [Rarobacter incanus]